jgi:hypothetical protein
MRRIGERILAWLRGPIVPRRRVVTLPEFDPYWVDDARFPVYCPLCHYVLRGLPVGRCPECARWFVRDRLRFKQYIRDWNRIEWLRTPLGRWHGWAWAAFRVDLVAIFAVMMCIGSVPLMNIVRSLTGDAPMSAASRPWLTALFLALLSLAAVSFPVIAVLEVVARRFGRAKRAMLLRAVIEPPEDLEEKGDEHASERGRIRS